MEEMFIIMWIVVISGVLYSFKQFGDKKYSTGMSDAINMHHSGALKYRMVPTKNGKNKIEIKVNGG
jgi:ribosomal protein S4E